MKITIPDFCVVMLIGSSGTGKSTFANSFFAPTECLSSDTIRGWVDDDENSLEATTDAFETLHHLLRTRLRRRRLTVIDATNVSPDSRRGILEIAREHYAQVVGVVFDLKEEVCHERNAQRPDRQFGRHVVRNQQSQLRRSVRFLGKEGVRVVAHFRNPEEVALCEGIVREPLWVDQRGETGPFDIIGDVHGCIDELHTLLKTLGWKFEGDTLVSRPDRKLVFVGDLIDRGPDSMKVLDLVMKGRSEGWALCVPGNHDEKLLKYLRGRDVKLSHGLAETAEAFKQQPESFQGQVKAFLDNLPGHLWMDGGKLVVAHAGIRESMIGRAAMRIRDFCLYGETSGEMDEYGLPVRYEWALDYRGAAKIVYGHTPVEEPEWLNGTLCIDTACVFGGSLTALRYPEMELVSTPANQAYFEAMRPPKPSRSRSAQGEHDDVLDLEDVTGRRHIRTRLRGNIVVDEEHAAAALETLSRFAAPPQWLVYLPPTMSPCETSTMEGYLERPEEAFTYFRGLGVETVVCEEKHMGSRAVVVLARDAAAARRRFGVHTENRGIVLTRTGRRFFDDSAFENVILDEVDRCMVNSGLWEELNSDWVVLDTELMPWSAKAVALLRGQYAPVATASSFAVSGLLKHLNTANAEGIDAFRSRVHESQTQVTKYREAYRRYCWRVNSPQDLRLAPFHLMAAEGRTFTDQTHVWHMGHLHRLCEGSSMLVQTPYRVVDLNSETSILEASAWWDELTEEGGEGMVVKPLHYVTHTEKGLIQPAVKVRGSEYLRIIYGPEYDRPDYLERLRKRGLGRKRNLAIKEFALGLEALERFVAREPLRRVHECVFGVLAFESEAVDPRL